MKLSHLCLIGFISMWHPEVISSETDTQGWMFTFPESISVLKNSDVTIPCSFTSPDNQSEVNVIWYKYHSVRYPQIFNSKEPSLVISEYRGRTALVANGTRDCSLKITNVRETEEFFPGISEKINSWDLNKKKKIKVQVTGCSDSSPCRGWWFALPFTINALEGSCMDLRCTFIYPGNAGDFNFFWYKRSDMEIFNNKSQSDVHPMYEGRTLLTGDTRNNCSIRINDINKEDKGEYFAGVNSEINSYTLQDQRIVKVSVLDRPKEVTVSVVGETVTTGGDNVTLRCTSQANPPKTQYTWYQIRTSGRLLQGDGDTITVKNETTKQYICTATNTMGTGESPAFQLIGQSESETVTVLYVLIGTAAVLMLITVLFILYCMITRMKRKILVNGTTFKKSTKAQEHIPLDDHLYGNVDHNQPKRDQAGTRLSRPPDDSHIYGNTGVPQGGDINPSKGEVPEEPYGVVYTQIDLSALGDGRQHPITLENTQYATLKHA